MGHLGDVSFTAFSCDLRHHVGAESSLKGSILEQWKCIVVAFTLWSARPWHNRLIKCTCRAAAALGCDFQNLSSRVNEHQEMSVAQNEMLWSVLPQRSLTVVHVTHTSPEQDIPTKFPVFGNAHWFLMFPPVTCNLPASCDVNIKPCSIPQNAPTRRHQTFVFVP